MFVQGKFLLPFTMEKWQSGRMRRFWKPLFLYGNWGVWIPLSPPPYNHAQMAWFFILQHLKTQFWIMRKNKKSYLSEAKVILGWDLPYLLTKAKVISPGFGCSLAGGWNRLWGVKIRGVGLSILEVLSSRNTDLIIFSVFKYTWFFSFSLYCFIRFIN